MASSVGQIGPSSTSFSKGALRSFRETAHFLIDASAVCRSMLNVGSTASGGTNPITEVSIMCARYSFD